MTVTATFQPSTIAAAAGSSASFALQLHNDATAPAVLQLTPVGALAEHTAIETQTVHLGPGENLDVPVVVGLDSNLTPGLQTAGVEVLTGLGETVAAMAAIDIEQTTTFAEPQSPDYTVSLSPARSGGASTGRHKIIVDNKGRSPVMVEFLATALSTGVVVDVAAPLVNVDPGKDARIELRVHPKDTYWSGGVQEHPFNVTVTGDGGLTQTFEGVFEQGPRLRPWLIPAVAGALGGLALGAIAWFALLRPATESMAEDRAAAAVEEQQEAFDAQIAEIEDIATRSRQLPLGAPADLRLNVEAAPASSATESYTVASDRVLSVTDIVFQNPDGAVGRVALLRNGDVLLESELANFRDLDLHFVAPFRFDGSDTVEIRIECETPGPDDAVCTAGVSIVGFVDQPD